MRWGCTEKEIPENQPLGGEAGVEYDYNYSRTKSRTDVMCNILVGASRFYEQYLHRTPLCIVLHVQTLSLSSRVGTTDINARMELTQTENCI